MKNWKTTATGVASIAGAVFGLIVGFKHGTLTEEKVMIYSTMLTTGIGLIFAKDKNVTGGTVKQ